MTARHPNSLANLKQNRPRTNLCARGHGLTQVKGQRRCLLCWRQYVKAWHRKRRALQRLGSAGGLSGSA